MPERYEPNYKDITMEPNTMTKYGFTSRELVAAEEVAQKDIAEYPEWLLAIILYSVRGKVNVQNSRTELEALGFKILREFDDLFYATEPPEGWTKSTSGYWTTVLDSEGREIIKQFYKGTLYDRRAHLDILEVE